MDFTFEPMSDEQIKALNMISPGIYDYEVIKAQCRTSKKGNTMMELQLMVWDLNGKEHLIFDYLVNTPGMIHKLKHFCDSTGLINQYTSGCLKEYDCVGKRGKLDLIIQNGNKNSEGKDYPDKNAVKDYLFKSQENNTKAASKQDADFNDDIPF